MQLSLPLGDSNLPPVRDRLLGRYGPQRNAKRHNPDDQFIKAMLSSCTYDAVSNAVFLKLRQHISSWEDLLDIPSHDIEMIVADITRPREKVRDILTSIHEIKRQRGTFSLSFLGAYPPDAAMTWLQTLDGVGPKIAAATLGFSDLRQPVLTVDRHVLRLGICLRLLPKRATFVRGFHLLTALVPPDWTADDLYELHWLMKMHGQKVCKSTRPLCYQCVLADLCPSYRSNSQQRSRSLENASQLH